MCSFSSSQFSCQSYLIWQLQPGHLLLQWYKQHLPNLQLLTSKGSIWSKIETIREGDANRIYRFLSLFPELVKDPLNWQREGVRKRKIRHSTVAMCYALSILVGVRLVTFPLRFSGIQEQRKRALLSLSESSEVAVSLMCIVQSLYR